MTPKTEAELVRWRGRSVISAGGERIGTLEEIYVDERTGRPEWLAVKTGLLGSKVAYIPVQGAESTESGVRVPYHRTDVKVASYADSDGPLSVEAESALYRHYGIEDADAIPAPAPAAAPPPTAAPAPAPTPAPEPDPAGEAMTRSEEELRVGTTEREAGRVRLRKHVVTENVTTTVPVQREELRIEREPITEADRGAAPAISEEEQEVVLHEEQVVVEKRVVPKERVRLGKKTVTEEQTVSEEVRKERIETDGTDVP